MGRGPGWADDRTARPDLAGGWATEAQAVGQRRGRLSRERAGADAAAPWPVDPDRVFSNELADARETLKAHGGAFDALARAFDSRIIQPGEAEHARARGVFEEQLVVYERDLREWLDGYRQAARDRADTFRLTLVVENAPSGAHAEGVTVVIDLPDGAELVDELPDVGPPPERPVYQPPKPRRRGATAALDDWNFPSSISPSANLADLASRVLSSAPDWKPVAAGRQLEAQPGEVHAGRSVPIREPLLVRLPRAGQHELRWTVYNTTARRPADGTLALDLREDPGGRPAFGRLHGVLSYPDVPVVKDDGHLLHDVRTGDPPAPPDAETAGSENTATETDAVMRRLHEAHAWWQWQALGLDPAKDGPERVDIRPVVEPTDDNDPSLR